MPADDHHPAQGAVSSRGIQRRTFVVAAAATVALPSFVRAQGSETSEMAAFEFINPDGMLQSPQFTQGIVSPAGARTLTIGGQNGVDAEGKLVSKDFGEQSAKAIDNLLKVLAGAGGKLEDLVRLGIYVKGDLDIRPGLEAWTKRWGERPNPPTITVLRVFGMGMSPDALIEVEATAMLFDGSLA